MNASINTFCLVILAAIVVLVTLQQAQDILAPIVAAFLLGVVMTPLSDLWEKLRLPKAVAAFLSVLLALAMILLILLLLEPYISLAISQAPVIRDELRASIRELRALLSGLEQLSDDMVAAIELNGSTGSGDGASELPSLTDALFYAPQFAAQFLIFTGTLYFFLLARDSVYDWLSRRIAPLQKSDLHLAAKQVARYVLTISAINFGFGTLVVVVMHLIGMPYPVIWGLLAFLLNFVLYLGPAALVAMLTVTGMVAFDGAASFVPPALYLAMNATEAQFVTPTLVGKSLAVNPLLIFLSLIFWLWLWGPIGGIIAIPLLIWTWTVFRGFGDQAISGGTPGKN
ncbi:AI-2E family transporter [uncultured Sulfitobacter sp.]|uniref:AI-2E family transporter n=1 Tax=uncultured Sulfitobacter sp. TaxID=191468 RepID=UPI00263297D1|nr:AI-2E family transporter [uncultured Sulfitobacter sp.]